jgi:diacylglycerol kinase (ATP)
MPRKDLVRRLLIVSPSAGGVDRRVEGKLAKKLPGFMRIDFDPSHDFRRHIAADATVVVAGGDGTIGFVARALAGSPRRLGIVPLGTFNNFGRALGLPASVDRALEVVLTGRPRFITLGKVQDTYFLEMAAVGLFGQAIEVGEKAKEGELAGMTKELGQLVGAKPFEYEIKGDLDGYGKALSLVFANTPSTGALMPVGGNNPLHPKLELSVRVGASRTDLVGRMLAGAILDKYVEDEGMHFRFGAVRVSTRPRVAVFCDNKKVGRTPVDIRADPRALRVILPK